MPLTDSYKSILLDADWGYQKYYGWKSLIERSGLRLFKKNVGPVRRYLVLSQLNLDQLAIELTKLHISSPLSIITVKDFSNQHQGCYTELLLDGLHVPQADDADRLLNKYTFVVNLNQESDRLWANMHSDNKRVCRKAIASGMVVESVSSPPNELLALFFERYRTMANERSLASLNEKIINQMFDDGRLRMHYARNANNICTIALVYSVALKSIFLYGVSGDHKNDGSAQLLHWKIIEHLKRAGQHWYDLGGVPEISDSNGIYRFKRSLGGEGFDLGPEYYYCPGILLVAKRAYKKLRSML